MRFLRLLLLLAGAGPVYYLAFNIFFIWSGAQNVLADPDMQSSKFLKVFLEYPPPPRMATDSWLLWKGFVITGLAASLAFLLVSRSLPANRWSRGCVFGFVHWLLMVPWFEFYLPYNVMHEPMMLVLLEAGLWLCVTLFLGMYMSMVWCINK